MLKLICGGFITFMYIPFDFTLLVIFFHSIATVSNIKRPLLTVLFTLSCPPKINK